MRCSASAQDQAAILKHPPVIVQKPVGKFFITRPTAEHDDFTSKDTGRAMKLKPCPAAQPGAVKQDCFLRHPFQKLAILRADRHIDL